MMPLRDTGRNEGNTLVAGIRNTVKGGDTVSVLDNKIGFANYYQARINRTEHEFKTVQCKQSERYYNLSPREWKDYKKEVKSHG